MLDKIKGVLQAVRAAGDGSVWKPLSMKITGWGGGGGKEPMCAPGSGFGDSHLLPSEGKSFPWYRMMPDLRTSYMAAVGEVALLWICVLSICSWHEAHSSKP